MKVEPSGVVMIGECEIRTPFCTALTPAPITAVWGIPARRQTDVCGRCLEEMVRRGEWEIQGSKLPRKYDLAVYDKNERLQLVIEVQNTPYKRSEELENWATRIRRNLVIHSGIPTYVYFLLAAYPAPFFLWGADEASEAPPHYRFNVQAEMPRLDESKTVSDYQQQVDAVYDWLLPLVSASAEEAEPQAWLDASGLRDALRGGRIVRREIPTPPRREREPQAA